MFEERVKYLKTFIFYVLNRFAANRCSSIAAELTITSLLALVPLTAVVFTLLAFIPHFQELGEQLQTLLFNYFVPETGNIVRDYVNEFVVKTKSLTFAGSIMLIATALLMMKTIESSFNKIWHIKTSRLFWQRLLAYFAVLLLGPILLGGSLLITSYIQSLPIISDMLTEYHQGITFWLPLIMISLAFGIMFFVIPNRKIVPINALYAGFITAVLFELAKLAFTYFVASFSTYQLIFGALASIPLFLIWIYLSWSILLLGAEICHALDTFKLKHNNLKKHPFIEVIELLVLLDSFYKVDKRFSKKQLKQSCQHEEISINMDWFEHLLGLGLILEYDEQNYSLAKSLEKIDYQTIYDVAGQRLPEAKEINNANLPANVKLQMLQLIKNVNQLLNDHLVVLNHPKSRP